MRIVLFIYQDNSMDFLGIGNENKSSLIFLKNNQIRGKVTLSMINEQ